MKPGFRKAAKIYKYLAILFTIAYWICMVVDDWGFIEKYWKEDWGEYLWVWVMWYVVYFMAFSFYYWLLTTIIVLIYYNLIKRKRTKAPAN